MHQFNSDLPRAYLIAGAIDWHSVLCACCKFCVMIYFVITLPRFSAK